MIGKGAEKMLPWATAKIAYLSVPVEIRRGDPGEEIPARRSRRGDPGEEIIVTKGQSMARLRRPTLVVRCKRADGALVALPASASFFTHKIRIGKANECDGHGKYPVNGPEALMLQQTASVRSPFSPRARWFWLSCSRRLDALRANAEAKSMYQAFL